MVSYPTGYAAITGGLIESFQLKLHAADVASLKCAIQRLELFKGVDSAWSLRYTRTCYNILLAFYLSLSLSLPLQLLKFGVWSFSVPDQPQP